MQINLVPSVQPDDLKPCRGKMKIVLLLAFLLALSHGYLHAATVTVTGRSMIGSGLTLEDARIIALNDAQQKALNSFGAYIESSKEIIKGVLTKEQVTSITGAIVKSKILKTSKEVNDDVFVLNVLAKFEIDEYSLNRAISNYQDRSRDRRIIRQLSGHITKLQKQIQSQKTTNYKTLTVVSEINAINQKLDKLLTTKQIIDSELSIQDIYKGRIAQYIYGIFPNLFRDIISGITWHTVPEEYIGRLCLNAGKKWFFTDWGKYAEPLRILIRRYNSRRLSTRPELSFRVEFAIPVILYINGRKVPVGVIPVTFKTGWQLLSVAYNRDIGNHGIPDLSSRQAKICLPGDWRLQDIDDIQVRYGLVQPSQIKFSFWGRTENMFSRYPRRSRTITRTIPQLSKKNPSAPKPKHGIYKWIDKDGGLHLSCYPPPSDGKRLN